MTPLLFAAYNNTDAGVEKLLAAGADANTASTQTVLAPLDIHGGVTSIVVTSLQLYLLFIYLFVFYVQS
eukprot:COSAG01_NODE_5383_length_4295_cov_2.871306_7_plen_69_part_00